MHQDGYRKSNLILLYGTVPIFYRSASYNIPMNIWFLETYPNEPPRCLVTPTEGQSYTAPPARLAHVHAHAILTLLAAARALLTCRVLAWAAGAEMRIKERHRCVDQRGVVSIRDYQWTPGSSTLLEYIQIVISVFSNEPPVFRHDGGPSVDERPRCVEQGAARAR